MSSLKLNGVNKIYPSGESALFNIEFQTKDKEFIVIVGGEASGKSTLLRIIAGLEEPSSGAVLIDNKDVTDVDPKDRDVAMVFRSSTLYPALNVFDNMAFGLRLRKAPQAVIEQSQPGRCPREMRMRRGRDGTINRRMENGTNYR